MRTRNSRQTRICIHHRMPELYNYTSILEKKAYPSHRKRRRNPLWPTKLSLLLSFVFFTATALAQPTELFISEYIEGSSNNKAIEIYNGTGSSIDLAAGNYQLLFFFNGNTSPNNTISLSGTVAHGSVGGGITIKEK